MYESSNGYLVKIWHGLIRFIDIYIHTKIINLIVVPEYSPGYYYEQGQSTGTKKKRPMVNLKNLRARATPFALSQNITTPPKISSRCPARFSQKRGDVSNGSKWISLQRLVELNPCHFYFKLYSGYKSYK